MKIGRERQGSELRSPRARSMHLARLVLIALALTVLIVLLAVGPQWFTAITPRWLIRTGESVFLLVSLAIFVAAVPMVLIGGVWSIAGAVRGYRRRDRESLERHARRLLLVASSLLGVVAMETASAMRLRALARLPKLPTRFSASPSSSLSASNPKIFRNTDNSPREKSRASDDGLSIVVVGESSALGVPYDPWLSVGQIVAWQLEQVFPGRRVEVDMRAEPGLCLEHAVARLTSLERRPDVMLIFLGHNEFQSRFSWSRNVAHYVDEGANSWLGMLDRVRSLSAACKLILTTLDLTCGENVPPQITRDLVDHPTCSPSEYAFLRDDFQLRLDALLAYCERIRSLPIVIVPGSNDGAFEPSRSVLDGSTTAEQRTAFAKEFQAVRASESVDATASIQAYRRLISRHPEFAETHYRLGRLLAASGAWKEAGEHFIRARDLDGLPLRCPSDFREVLRAVARRYHAVLIDGEELFSHISPHGILDDHLYHDGHHPNLLGIVALANDVLAKLHERRAFGWPAMTPVPHITIEACARQFNLDVRKWSEICLRSASFYKRTAYVRFDPSERLGIEAQYVQASRDLFAGKALRDRTNPNIGIAESLLQTTGQLGIE